MSCRNIILKYEIETMATTKKIYIIQSSESANMPDILWWETTNIEKFCEKRQEKKLCLAIFLSLYKLHCVLLVFVYNFKLKCRLSYSFLHFLLSYFVYILLQGFFFQEKKVKKYFKLRKTTESFWTRNKKKNNFAVFKAIFWLITLCFFHFIYLI